MALNQLRSSDRLKKLWEIEHALPAEQKYVVYGEEKSQLVMLNEIGGALWSLIDGERTIEEIAGLLAVNIDDAPSADEIQRQILPFLEELLEAGALTLLGRS